MTISVTQLNNYVRGLLDIDGVLNSLSVCGEITNLKKSRDGWYFSLKDEAASVNCFCYDSVAVPEQGNVVVAEGQLNYFVKSGSVSFFVKRLVATKNTGEAYLRFVELKEKLKKEGLFDDERKRIVPHCCNTVGVVTSENGAVIHDITNVVLRRQPFTDVVLYPVKVQGTGSEEEIARGIGFFNGYPVDAVIVGRGGGSNEDLSAFNTESVVRAVAACNKPVVSAVGHGVDYTLCDFAADKRAVTPSEAAEFVTMDAAAIKNRLTNDLERIANVLRGNMQSYGEKTAYVAERIGVKVDTLFERNKRGIIADILTCERKFEIEISEREKAVENGITRLTSINPVNVLKRGYAYLSGGSGIIKSVRNISVGDDIKLTLQDGEITATVKEKVTK